MQVYRSMDARMLEKHALNAVSDGSVCVQINSRTYTPPPATRRTVGEVIKPAIQASFEHDRTFTRAKPVFPAGIS